MTKSKINKLLTGIVFGLFIYMPFHLFISRWLSLYTGRLDFWETGKDIVTIIGLVLATYIYFRDKLWTYVWLKILIILIAVYGLMHLVFLTSPFFDRKIILAATLFNGRFLAYLFISAVTASLPENKNILDRYKKPLIVVSLITAGFAILQFFLPKDLMTHFGYSIARGAKPNFFIDDKPDFPRVMAFIRDPNSLGAYLIVPITYFWVVFAKGIKTKNKINILFMSLCIVALILTFSRGAFIGLAIALFISSFYIYKKVLLNFAKKYWILLSLILILFCGVLVSFRSNYIVSNIIYHSDSKTIEADPNEKRIELQTRAIKEISRNPAGYSPGTAGLISIGNKRVPGILTENYFLQIAYEIGILGLVLFLTITILVYRQILKSPEHIFKPIIIGSFWGYIFICLLIHLWSNEAVAAQWWILSGLLIGGTLDKRERLKSKTNF